MDYLCPYLILINAAAFLFMLADKYRAKKKMWRIPEAVLLSLAFAGGSGGTMLAMVLARHKVRKPRFAVTVPLLLAAQAVIVWMLLR